MFSKEHYDRLLIDLIFEHIFAKRTEYRKKHIVYAGEYYYRYKRLGQLILEAMKKYRITSVVMTIIFMRRFNLITKEEVDAFCKGRRDEEESVNDDLEALFENHQLGREQEDWVWTYFLPQLTEDELKLVEMNDPSYIATFETPHHPDVDKKRMNLSASTSKFVHGKCRRKTSIFHSPRIIKIKESSPEHRYTQL